MENNSPKGLKTADLNNAGQKLSFFDSANYLLSDLPERSQEILAKRFGLSGEKPQTLEKIGKDYKITRERVRQIISDALRKVSGKQNDEKFKQAEEKIIFTIHESDGIIKEQEILERLGDKDKKEINAIKFFSAISDRILIEEVEKIIEKSWTVSKDIVEKAKELSVLAEEILQIEKKLLIDNEIVDKISSRKAELTKKQIANFLKVFSKIKKNKFEKWGLAHWAEINPKGTRERIYLVLKEQGSPLHFSEIAKLIDEHNLSKKKAHPQTVHNELIKDDRFVLIGRGIYALKEWGYKQGTIKDVLEDILAKSGKPLTKEEILSEVMKVRKVKKATVLINLNNGNSFVKLNDAYTVKK